MYKTVAEANVLASALYLAGVALQADVLSTLLYPSWFVMAIQVGADGVGTTGVGVGTDGVGVGTDGVGVGTTGVGVGTDGVGTLGVGTDGVGTVGVGVGEQASQLSYLV